MTPYVIALGVVVALMTYFHVSSHPSPGSFSSVGPSYLPPNLGWVAFLFPSASKVDATICRAEANYWENVERRRKEFRGVLQPVLANPVRMKELILVPMYTCPLNERIGKWGDGGKWACMMQSVIQKKDPVVYSVGSFGMYSFEEEMHEALRTMPYTFDPFLSPEKLKIMTSLPFLHFIEIGLSGSASLPAYHSKFPAKKFATLPELMGQFGHSYVDVFKIDCEGCEVELIKDLGKEYSNTDKRLAVHGGKLPFGQILIEFHNMDKSVKTLAMFYTLENLGYRLFSIEYNHQCAVCCEMSFIHESLVRPGSATDCRPFLAPPLENKLEMEGMSAGDGAAAAAAAAALAAAAAADSGDIEITDGEVGGGADGAANANGADGSAVATAGGKEVEPAGGLPVEPGKLVGFDEPAGGKEADSTAGLPVEPGKLVGFDKPAGGKEAGPSDGLPVEPGKLVGFDKPGKQKNDIGDTEQEGEEEVSEKVGGNKKVKVRAEGKEGSSKKSSKVTGKGSVKGNAKESTKAGKKISEKTSKMSKKEIKEAEDEEEG
ncbi:unnamed protein product [Closterium sp. Yama58-4]|nr:unnamed protein product [Closterium sp. Yama58-4]